MNNVHIAADAARFDEIFRNADAIRTEADGFQWIDETKVPAGIVSAYRNFMSHCYANGTA